MLAAKAAVKPPRVEEGDSGDCELTLHFLVLAGLRHQCKDGV